MAGIYMHIFSANDLCGSRTNNNAVQYIKRIRLFFFFSALLTLIGGWGECQDGSEKHHQPLNFARKAGIQMETQTGCKTKGNEIKINFGSSKDKHPHRNWECLSLLAQIRECISLLAQRWECLSLLA